MRGLNLSERTHEDMVNLLAQAGALLDVMSACAGTKEFGVLNESTQISAFDGVRRLIAQAEEPLHVGIFGRD